MGWKNFLTTKVQHTSCQVGLAGFSGTFSRLGADG